MKLYTDFADSQMMYASDEHPLINKNLLKKAISENSHKSSGATSITKN